MNARMQCAFKAQNEDDAIQCHRDLRMVMLTKSIESTESLIDLKMKMYDRMGLDGSDIHSLTVINLLMEKLEQLNTDLESMVSEVRLNNPIVGYVMDNVKIAMGLVTKANGNYAIGLVTDTTMEMPKCDEEYDNDEDVVEDGVFVEEVINNLD